MKNLIFILFTILLFTSCCKDEVEYYYDTYTAVSEVPDGIPSEFVKWTPKDGSESVSFIEFHNPNVKIPAATLWHREQYIFLLKNSKGDLTHDVLWNITSGTNMILHYAAWPNVNIDDPTTDIREELSIEYQRMSY